MHPPNMLAAAKMQCVGIKLSLGLNIKDQGDNRGCTDRVFIKYCFFFEDF